MDRIRAEHVVGMGDVAFRGFNCLGADCTRWIVVRDDEIGDAFDIPCPLCGFLHRSADKVTFYNFILRDIEEDFVIEEGEFAAIASWTRPASTSSPCRRSSPRRGSNVLTKFGVRQAATS